LIAFTATFTSSLLQPLVGLYSDRHSKPYFLAAGMSITLAGLLTLAISPTYAIVLIAAGLIGTGSAVFHPESSRVARMASGGQHGFAQSIFLLLGQRQKLAHLFPKKKHPPARFFIQRLRSKRHWTVGFL
jgi:FSR family fosmidomycin resistance protein-like MFS transporter